MALKKASQGDAYKKNGFNNNQAPSLNELLKPANRTRNEMEIKQGDTNANVLI